MNITLIIKDLLKVAQSSGRNISFFAEFSKIVKLLFKLLKYVNQCHTLVASFALYIYNVSKKN